MKRIKKIIRYIGGILFAAAIVSVICVPILTDKMKRIMLADHKDAGDEAIEERTDAGQEETASSAEILKEEALMKELEIRIMENRENEWVFSFSIEDFIDSYNGIYWKDKEVRYLLPSQEWEMYLYDTSIHSGHETCRYIFSKDKTILPFPTITVYVPSNDDLVQEITVDFDDHSYMDSLYKVYEEMCFYTLKTVFPDLEDEKIINLYTTLNQLAYENVMPVKYASGAVPCALYYRGDIGVYPYFALGDYVRLCVIPVTPQYLDQLRAQGVGVYEIL